MKQRFRNSPPIREVILKYMASESGVMSFDDIYRHVSKSVTLVTKTPRNSVFSVLTRIGDVERIGPDAYKLKRK